MSSFLMEVCQGSNTDTATQLSTTGPVRTHVPLRLGSMLMTVPLAASREYRAHDVAGSGRWVSTAALDIFILLATLRCRICHSRFVCFFAPVVRSSVAAGASSITEMTAYDVPLASVERLSWRVQIENRALPHHYHLTCSGSTMPIAIFS